MENEKYCTVLVHYDKGVPPTSEDLNTRLESKNDKVKAEALEELVLLMVNGESYPKLLMSIIKFVVASTDHRVKKLLTIYWEVVEKCKENGDLKEEMILVCNALRNDLLHPNEYIRGSTLRLLCKMKYYRILEPLKEAVLRNLSHRHSYVRRNAAMCVYAIIKTFGIDVIPDAPEDIEQLLLVEGDLSTKRNAFLMLLHCDQERAIKYILSMQDQVSTMGDIFQLATLELVRKVCRTNPALKGRLLRIVFNLVGTTSTAVSYECASTLVSLSSSSVAVHSATQAHVTLLTEQSDNNVKLIVLDRLQEVRKKHKGVMEGMVMDIFRALSCPSIDVRKKVMDICLGNLVSSRNIEEVVGYLKKEVTKTLGYEAQSIEGNTEYRRLLIRALHACTAQYHDQAHSVVFLLMDFLTEADQNTASEVVMFLRELVSSYPDLRVPILQRLCQSVPDIQQSRVLRGILWLFGEYCEEEGLIVEVLEALVGGLKPLPLAVPVDATVTKDNKKEGADAPKGKYVQKTVVLKDGTYGTENVWNGTPEEEAAERAKAAAAKKGEAANAKKSHLRQQVLGGDCLLSAMVGVSMTKLSLKATGLSVMLRNEILLCLVNIYKLVAASSALGDRSDSAVRLTQCIRLLAGNAGSVLEDHQLAACALMKAEWKSQCGRNQLGKVIELTNQTCEWKLGQELEEEQKSVGPDELIVFRQLRERKGGATNDTAMDEDDFGVARGSTLALGASDGELFAERLAKVQQMSGLADPVYVEAFLQVHSFDLVLELLLVNRTTETLQNVLVELSTQGDLKLVDRPVAVTLAPGQQLMTYASIKVSSTETGVIFGYLTFDKGSGDKECTVLNQLHVDILDYIERSWIGEMAFRTMWSEFEWENKININTTICDVGPFLVHIMRHTNMSIVGRQYKKDEKGKKQKGKLTAEDVQEMIDECTGIKRLIDSSSFVAVNLYAKSIFGEDALANISIEKTPDGKLTGSVRIRSRTQGIALSLGDRITIVQRGAQGPQ